MRIDLSNEPTLSFLHKVSISWKRYSYNDKICFLNSVFFNSRERFRCQKAQEYCEHNGIEFSDLKTAYNGLRGFDIKAFDSIFMSFNVEIVSSTFEEETLRSAPKLYDTLGKKSIYEIVGSGCGILILNNTITLYYISKEGSFFETLNRRDNTQSGSYFYQFGGGYCLPPYVGEGHELTDSAVLPILALLFKEIAEIRTKQIEPNTTQRSIDTNTEESVIHNQTPFRITHTDSTWYTTYVRSESFQVRGFWRRQRCGQNRSSFKWVFIKPFEKRGYCRRAKKLIQEAA